MKNLWRLIRSIFCGCLFAWIAVSMMSTELEILTNSSYSKYMALDPYYGYLSIRTFYENIVIVGLLNFILGFFIGILWKPGSIKL